MARGQTAGPQESLPKEGVRGRTKACETCGVVLTTRNMARHVDRFHRIWDPGGGPAPDGGRRPQTGTGTGDWRHSE